MFSTKGPALESLLWPAIGWEQSVGSMALAQAWQCVSEPAAMTSGQLLSSSWRSARHILTDPA